MHTFLQILSIVIPVLFAITLHEVGHGWTAKQFGDRTAENQGRLTLNPIAHMDHRRNSFITRSFTLPWGIGFWLGKTCTYQSNEFEQS